MCQVPLDCRACLGRFSLVGIDSKEILGAGVEAIVDVRVDEGKPYLAATAGAWESGCYIDRRAYRGMVRKACRIIGGSSLLGGQQGNRDDANSDEPTSHSRLT